jgi:hypothetical protein
MPAASTSGADNLLAQFVDLQQSARTAVRIHAGNKVKLDNEREHVSHFLALLNQVRCLLQLLATLAYVGLCSTPPCYLRIKMLRFDAR